MLVSVTFLPPTLMVMKWPSKNAAIIALVSSSWAPSVTSLCMSVVLKATRTTPGETTVKVGPLSLAVGQLGERAFLDLDARGAAVGQLGEGAFVFLAEVVAAALVARLGAGLDHGVEVLAHDRGHGGLAGGVVLDLDVHGDVDTAGEGDRQRERAGDLAEKVEVHGLSPLSRGAGRPGVVRRNLGGSPRSPQAQGRG